jgi:hypothetical protein
MRRTLGVMIACLGLVALLAVVAAPSPPPRTPVTPALMEKPPAPAWWLETRLAQTSTLNRRYWPTSVDSLAAGRAKHTHIEVRSRVSAVRHEDDGDLHIVLQAKSAAFIVAECIPKLPCVPPRVGDSVTVRGISRRDPEHPWWEVHPVEELLH